MLSPLKAGRRQHRTVAGATGVTSASNKKMSASSNHLCTIGLALTSILKRVFGVL